VYKKYNTKMITSQKALEIILNSTADFGTESVPFIESPGRILKENVVADRDFPPFDRVSMDGVAINIDAFNQGQRQFKIEGVQAAGSPQLTLKNPKNCIEAMTGAVLPKNTNAVIQYELTETQNGVVTLNTDAVKYFKNIHKKGLDCTKGTPLLSENTVISAAEIGVLATVGKTQVKVAKHPKICIISTGDELVEVSQTPLPHQIRRSNVFTLVALLKRLKLKTNTLHIKDDKVKLKQKVEQALNNYDVLMFSGAVSKGKFDFIPEVLGSLGVEKLFHRVKQKPGKPFWFGEKESKKVFAFPGNPVSTFVSCLKYFYPWYYKSVGLKQPNKTAILASDYTFKAPLTYFLQVTLENKNGCLYAHPLTGNGSGDLANMALADAFIELPGEESSFKKGQIFSVLGYR
jgi:molybdopterin molybdotransferase